MQKQPKGPLPPPRGVPKSVSDLYGTDEIDFLLDEIKDLEPACCQLEDIQVDPVEAPLKPPRTRLLQTTNHKTNNNYNHHHKNTNYSPPPQPPNNSKSTAIVQSTSNTTTTTTTTATTAQRGSTKLQIAAAEKYLYTPSPIRGAHHQHQSHIEDNTDDNFILIIPSPKLSAKHDRSKRDVANKKAGFLKRVFGRKGIEGVEQQQQKRIHFLQTDRELHEIELCDAKGRRKKKSKKNLVVLAGRVDTEDDEDIVPISIGENDDVTDDLPGIHDDSTIPLDSNGEDNDRDDDATAATGGGGGGGLSTSDGGNTTTTDGKKDERKDFDIAGSRAGGVSLDLESPLGTVTSWDSHAFYKQRIGLAQMSWGVQLHCDIAHLKSLTGIFRVLLVISSIICLAFECSAGTVQVGLFLLPLIGRLRLMVFCALFSLLVTCLMLFLDISHIALMFPFNWSKVNAFLYLCVGLLFLIGSSLVVHAVMFAEAFSWVPRHTKDTLFVSAMFGYACAVEAFVLSAVALCCSAKYLQVPEDQNELCERDREMRPMNSNHKFLSRRGKTGKRVSKRDLVSNHIKGGPLAGQPMDEGDEEEDEEEGDEDEEEEEEEEADDTDENQVMLNSASGDDVPNHRNHNPTTAARGSMSSFTHKPYIPAKRPDQAYNKQPTLGHHNSQVKTNSRYRQGYHYQPIASTSTAQSPTFVLDEVRVIPGPSTSRSMSVDTA